MCECVRAHMRACVCVCVVRACVWERVEGKGERARARGGGWARERQRASVREREGGKREGQREVERERKREMQSEKEGERERGREGERERGREKQRKRDRKAQRQRETRERKTKKAEAGSGPASFFLARPKTCHSISQACSCVLGSSHWRKSTQALIGCNRDALLERKTSESSLSRPGSDPGSGKHTGPGL